MKNTQKKIPNYHLPITLSLLLLLAALTPTRAADPATPPPPYDIHCTASYTGTAILIKMTISITRNNVTTVLSAPAVKMNDGCSAEIEAMTQTAEPLLNPDGTPQYFPPTAPGAPTDKIASKTLLTGIKITVVKPADSNQIVYFATALNKNIITWAHADTIKITPESTP